MFEPQKQLPLRNTNQAHYSNNHNSVLIDNRSGSLSDTLSKFAAQTHSASSYNINTSSFYNLLDYGPSLGANNLQPTKRSSDKTSAPINQLTIFKILALFGGGERDSVLDFRIGKHVLNIARERASQLYPNLDVQLLYKVDTAECSHLNRLAAQTARIYYRQKLTKSLNQSILDQGELQLSIAETFDYTDYDYVGESQSEYALERNYKQKYGNEREHHAGFDAILGPTCDFMLDLVARMASYWSVPIYNGGAIEASFSHKNVYTTLTRLSPSTDRIGAFLMQIMQRFKWHHVAIIVDMKQRLNELLLASIEATIDEHRNDYDIQHKSFEFRTSTSTSNSSSDTLNVHASEGSQEMSDDSKLRKRDAEVNTWKAHDNRHWTERELRLRDILTDVSRVARVVVLLLDPRSIRETLLVAHALAMNNGEYTFFAIDVGIASPVSKSAGDDDRNNTTLSESTLHGAAISWYSAQDETRNAWARQMFESLLVLGTRTSVSVEHEAFVEHVVSAVNGEAISSNNGDERIDNKSVISRAQVNHVAASFHDAVLLSCQAFNVGLRRQSIDGAYTDASWKHIWNKTFTGGLMGDTFINANGDQELVYVLNDMEPETGAWRVVGQFERSLELEGYIHWPTQQATTDGVANEDERVEQNEPPPDVPECGFQGDAAHCVERRHLYTILALTLFVVSVAGVTSGVSVYRYRKIMYQLSLDNYWWKIDWNELHFLQLKNFPHAVSGTRSIVHSANSLCASSIFGSLVDHQSAIVRLNNNRRSHLSNNSSHNVNINTHNNVSDQRGTVRKSSQESSVVSGQSVVSSNLAPFSFGIQRVSTKSGSKLLAPGDATTMISGVQSEAPGAGADTTYRWSEYSSGTRVGIRLATYNHTLVVVKPLRLHRVSVTRELLVELRELRELTHDNLTKYVGLCIDPGHVSVIVEFCSRGSLQDVLLNSSLELDWTFKYSIIGDIVSGLLFLHTSTNAGVHGRLKSTNCVIDSRFTLKLTDFGFASLYDQLEVRSNARALDTDTDTNADRYNTGSNSDHKQQQHKQKPMTRSSTNKSLEELAQGHSQSEHSEHPSVPVTAARLLWTAPESLRHSSRVPNTKAGDIYAFGIILSEIITRNRPYAYGTTAEPLEEPLVDSGKSKLPSLTSSTRSHISEQLRAHGGSLLSSRTSSVAPAPSSVGDSPDEQYHQPADHHSRTQGHGSARSKRSHTNDASNALTSGANKLRPTIEVTGPAVKTARHPYSADRSNVRYDGLEEERYERILDQIRMGTEPPVRPALPAWFAGDVSDELVALMRSCWSEQASVRPSVTTVRAQLRRITRGVANKNYLDNLLERLQSYAANLERTVEERSADIVEEKNRTEKILYRVMPKFVVEQLKLGITIAPQSFDLVTIFFSDIVNFEQYAQLMAPSQVVELLNEIYSRFDLIIASFDVVKIETIVDQFLVASGVSLAVNASAAELAAMKVHEDAISIGGVLEPATGTTVRATGGATGADGTLTTALMSSNDQQTFNSGNNSNKQHKTLIKATPQQKASAEQIARMAICVRDFVKSFQFRHAPSVAFNVRIGIHSGNVCAGLVGNKRPKYCLIGDTVNVASRMQTNSKANKIHISSDTKIILDLVRGFQMEPRGKIDIKGKGLMETFWLDAQFNAANDIGPTEAVS
ncbi:Receptor-type guanylate cyclase gcy-17, partial [Fragariocoptes setiger]